MDNRKVTYIGNAERITGYKVKIMSKPVFQVTGYTMIVPPRAAAQTIPPFVGDVMADGRLDELRKASSVPTWVLGLGSLDEECQPDEFRYTICIEQTEHTDLRRLAEQYQLHTQRFEACDWMCFEVSQERFLGELKLFWIDDPYKMLRALGYRFHLRVGVHFEAYPPDYDEQKNPGIEFWISVAKQTDDCDACSAKVRCARIQPFK